MTQLSLLRAPLVAVQLQCPHCLRVFLGGIIQPGVKWLGESPAQTAKQVYCDCGQAPPMRVVAQHEGAA